jgi:aspartate/methionine/tyrosine aminotransferase
MIPTSLTEMQLAGIGTGVNVAEGYPRQRLTPSQQAIVERFPELMKDAATTGFRELESRAHTAFFGALGQTSAPVGSGRLTSFYSSSQAIDVVARCLQETVDTVAVVSPTLDCIPALLRARRLEVTPVSEDALAGPDPFAEVAGSPGALFIANPNNPTGAHLDSAALAALAAACAERSVVLVIDQCFRAFDPRTQFDAYACLDATGVEYVVIEDTGKLWPVSGLKLGFLGASIGTRLPFAEAAADVLLTVSPFVARLVEELAIDMAAGGLRQLHELIAGNRACIAEALDGFAEASLADGASRVSVARVELIDPSATRIWGRLLQRGVHTVPCRPFYWADPDEGERYLRVALARNREDVEGAVGAIREVLAATVAA